MNNKIILIKKCIIVAISLSALFLIINFGFKHETHEEKHKYVPEVEFNDLKYSDFDQNTSAADCDSINLDSVDGDVININGGNYLLSGDFKGSIIVDAKDEKVHLFFNNFHITSLGGPAIIVKDCTKIVITLIDGSNNIVEDNGDYRMFDEYDACIDSSQSLTINGKGSLIVNGLYKDGIHSKDVLKIIDCSIESKVRGNSFQGNDGIRITNANMFVQSEKNGFKTTKSNILDKGYIYVEDSEMSIISGKISFVSKSNLYIKNSSINHRSVVTLYEVDGEAFIEEDAVK